MTGTATASAKTVLVADDTAFVRDRFKAALEGAGHKAVTVRSAAELLLRVRADLTQLDLLVLDLRLPHANGVDMVRNIRKIDGGKLPILVFSGTIASAEEVRELAALGVAGYVNEYSAVQHILPSLAPHLFPDNYNRRTSPRVVLGIPIAYRFGNTIAAALTLNLSHGGIAIRTTSPLEQDTRARLRFRLPGSKKDIDAEARVAWSDRRVGMGLQFEKVEMADQTAIDEFVDAHFFTNRKA
jgi:two-component system, chemotaxis family, chemotaxis protein CheY